jgi:uracil-DNA glycosylase family 4
MPKTVCEIEGCNGCPMRRLFPDSTFVAPRVGTNYRVMIGEAPGTTEAEQGALFVGSSGGWLRNIYAKAGLNEAENSALNVIQCQPPGNVFPTDPAARNYITDKEAYEAVAHCKKAHVEPFLRSRPWTRVDAFGDKPVRFILDKTAGISRWRGTALSVPILGDKLLAIPTFHPTYLAKDQAMLPVAINDLRKPLEKEPEFYNIFPSLADVKAFRATKFAFDIETSGWTKEISMVGFSAEDYTSIVVPFQGEYVNEIKRIFREATEVVGQNCIQFDLPVLAHNDVHVRGPKECMVWDIMLLHHLRFPTFPHDLEFIGKQFTNKGAWKYDKVQFETYCARDVDVTWRCLEPLKYLAIQAGLLDLYKYVSWPLARICLLMKETGLQRSSSRLRTLREELKANIAKAELTLPEELQPKQFAKRKRINTEPGYLNKDGKPARYRFEEGFKVENPWRSSDKKKKYLYETLGLPEQRNIKTKKVTADKSALDKLYTRHKLPVLKTLKDLSKWATLLSGFAKDTEIENDVVHPSFNVHGTETGRLSSSDPNIQNQPQAVRYTYVPRTPGGKIVSVDYSGIENRLVAHLANDRKRKGWFADPNFSEHKYLASVRQGIPYEDVEKSKDKDSPYAIAKIVVHGSDRMMGAKKISEQFDVDFAETKDFQATWKREIADTIAWQQRVANAGARTGWTVNPFSRKLWVWETNAATRIVSFLPQSTAADVIYRAMIACMYERIDWPIEWARKVAPIVEPLPEGVLLLAQVHDELLTETPSAELVDPTLEVLRKVMTQPWPELNGLSLPIGTGVGDSWGDCD